MFIKGVPKDTSITNIHSKVKPDKSRYFFFFLCKDDVCGKFGYELIHISGHEYEIDFKIFG